MGVAGSTAGISATLTGDYSSDVFVLLPAGPGSFSLLTAPGSLKGSTTPSPGTPSGHSFAWAAGGSGDWNTAGNWADPQAKQNPASIAPGSKDSVFVQGASEPNTVQVISGRGNAASLNFAGTTALSGTVTVGGTLGVGQIGNAAVVALIGGGALSAGSASIVAGMLDVANGTGLAVTGTLSIGTDPSQTAAPLEIHGGGEVQVGSLALSGSAAPIVLDSKSFLEVGQVGEPEAGVLSLTESNYMA